MSSPRSCNLYYNTDAMIQHVPPMPEFYMECPERIVAIEGALKGQSHKQTMNRLHVNYKEGKASLLSSIPVKEGSTWTRCKEVHKVEEGLSRDELIREYGKAAVNRWERCLGSGQNLGSGDIYWSHQTLRAASVAAAASKKAVEDVLSGKADTAFAIVRPPGHHCFQTPAGFCILNNIVLAAKTALEKGCPRVAIIDWDYHFGDGTARTFLRDPRVMFVSLHCEKDHYGNKTYPRNTSDNLKGDGLALRTKGRMFNVQWPSDNADDAAYTYVFQHLICPKVREFAPGLILISAGFDAVKGDVLAGMELTPFVFGSLASQIANLGIPTVAVLEGGYDPHLLGMSVNETVRGLLGDPSSTLSKIPEPSEEHKIVVDKVDTLLRSF